MKKTKNYLNSLSFQIFSYFFIIFSILFTLFIFIFIIQNKNKFQRHIEETIQDTFNDIKPVLSKSIYNIEKGINNKTEINRILNLTLKGTTISNSFFYKISKKSLQQRNFNSFFSNLNYINNLYKMNKLIPVYSFVRIDRKQLIQNYKKIFPKNNKFTKPPPKRIENDIIEKKHSFYLFENKDFIYITILSSFRPKTDRYQQTMINLLVLLGILMIAIISIISFLVSKKISKPILKLKDITGHIEKGNFNTEIDSHYINKQNNEFQDLLLSFNNMHQKLKDDEIFRKKLTSNISHEILTPLSIIKSSIYAIHDDIIIPNEDSLNNIEEEFIRLEEMINKIKFLDIIDSTNNTKSIIINKFLNSQIDKFQIAYPEIIFEYNDNTKKEILININKNELFSLISNLIKNGIKYNESNPKIIKIDLELKNNLELSICDNGIGIPENQKNNIFKRFYRIDNSRNSKTGGRGLGLAIVKDIVEKYSMEIDIKSNQKKGTKVLISFHNFKL